MRFLLPIALGMALLSGQDVGSDAAFFESRVRPVLAANCYACHGPDRQFSGLRLDSRAGIEKGGQRGAGPGLIVSALRHEGAVKMPPSGKLPERDIAAIETWLAKGYPWPGDKPVAVKAAPHWAFQPLRPTEPRGIDAFLGTKGPSADPRTLARRAAYAITGLPPKPDSLDRYIKDPSPAGWANYVDGLLASPHYGERWARHWLDLARFAETYGYEWNYEIHGAWEYRDYVIRAFNRDLPYDQFAREQIAGDLLPQPRVENGINESLIATAFWRLGEMGHDNCNQFPEIRTDVVDNQIDTFTKAFQGLTVSCARCHDHKFDPIPTEDYYSLYGILNSSRPVTRTVTLPQSADVEVLKQRIRGELAKLWLTEATDITKRWPALLERKEISDADPVYPILHPESLAGYPAEIQARAKRSAAFDFTRGLPAGWTAEGLGIRTVTAGSFAIATEGDAVLEAVFPAGLATNATTDKWNGTLRSPILPHDRKYITFQLSGAKAAAHRLVMDNCVIGEDHKLIEGGQLHLERVPTRNDQPLRTYLELNTITDNPRLPERPGKFKTNPAETSRRSWFFVSRAWLHDENEAPKPSLSHMRKLVETEPTQARIETLLADAVRHWAAGQAGDDDVVWINWGLANGLLSNSRAATPLLAEWTGQFRQFEAKLTAPEVVNGMLDADPGTDYPILLSGQARNPGRPAPRHFLSLMPKELRKVGLEGSGRLELAEAVANPANPLTARVYVNRVWHYLFGRGIVATTDNFGRLGDKPFNPELLDYLAGKFMQEGWSTKKLIREILLSGAYREENRIQRLDAEAVRDTILAVSGRMDETMYGPSIQPRRKEPIEHRRLFQGPLDGDGRRSVYLKVTRMQGPKFLEIFDFPAPLQTRGNRDVTNVPTQALAMLNDPFVLQQARFWAEHLVTRTGDTPAGRIDFMFNAALGRPPAPAERDAYLSLLPAFAAGKPELTDVTTWQRLAHTLFNSKEFLYLR